MLLATQDLQRYFIFLKGWHKVYSAKLFFCRQIYIASDSHSLGFDLFRARRRQPRTNKKI
jgi:hypothetical protein